MILEVSENIANFIKEHQERYQKPRPQAADDWEDEFEEEDRIWTALEEIADAVIASDKPTSREIGDHPIALFEVGISVGQKLGQAGEEVLKYVDYNHYRYYFLDEPLAFEQIKRYVAGGTWD